PAPGTGIRPIDSGVWRVTVFNDGPGPCEVHGYRQDLNSPVMAFFRAPTAKCTIDSPADHDGIIAVGSTVNRATWVRQGGGTVNNEFPVFDPTGVVTGARTETRLAISAFSNGGPVRRVNRQLDAGAPGGAVMSARSAQTEFNAPNAIVNPLTVVISGTSQACPVVTGLAACL